MLPHKHLLVRAEIENTISDISVVNGWLKNIIYLIGMNPLYGPVGKYSEKIGNKGVTSLAIIETSHIVVHIWDETMPGLMQLDVYTCSELDIDIIFKELDFFKPKKIDYKFLDREHDFKEIL